MSLATSKTIPNATKGQERASYRVCEVSPAVIERHIELWREDRLRSDPWVSPFAAPQLAAGLFPSPPQSGQAPIRTHTPQQSDRTDALTGYGPQ
jgi:hypothetical protein